MARERLVPSDVRWVNFYDQPRFVADSVGATRDAIVIGVLLAALVLLAILRSWRLALVAVVAIPLAAAVVGLGLAATGQTVNLMTLAGIAAALGFIADNAIVVVENIHRHAEQGAEGGAAAERGLREILPALVGSSLSTTVILLPFAFLSGITGAFFRPLALTMGLALVCSFLLVLLAVPVGVMSLFGGPSSRRSGPWHARLDRVRRRVGGSKVAMLARRAATAAGRTYDALVRLLVNHGVVAALVAASLLVVAYFFYRGDRDTAPSFLGRLGACVDPQPARGTGDWRPRRADNPLWGRGTTATGACSVAESLFRESRPSREPSRCAPVGAAQRTPWEHPGRGATGRPEWSSVEERSRSVKHARWRRGISQESERELGRLAHPRRVPRGLKDKFHVHLGDPWHTRDLAPDLVHEQGTDPAPRRGEGHRDEHPDTVLGLLLSDVIDEAEVHDVGRNLGVVDRPELLPHLGLLE